MHKYDLTGLKLEPCCTGETTETGAEEMQCIMHLGDQQLLVLEDITSENKEIPLSNNTITHDACMHACVQHVHLRVLLKC